MKALATIILLSCLTLSASTAHAQGCSNYDLVVTCPEDMPNHDWQLIFSDDFNGTELDHERWVTYFPFSGDGSDQCYPCRSGDGMNNIYRDENVSVSDGALHITAFYQPGTWFGHSKDYTSGVIYARDPWEFHHGRFEARMRIPGSYGQAFGLWPAFWLHGGSNVGQTEIDIMEICGGSQDVWRGTLHRSNLPGENEWAEHEYFTHDNGVSFADEYHTFTCEWDEYFIRMYIDGTCWVVYPKLTTFPWNNNVYDCYVDGCYATNNAFPSDPNAVLNMILNLAIANNSDEFCEGQSNIAQSAFPKVMYVDYVRVWKRGFNLGAFTPICNVPRAVVGERGFCAMNEEHEYTVSGAVGNLTWEVGTGLEILLQDDTRCLVRNIGLQDGQRSFVRALSNDGPCDSDGYYSISVSAGPPVWDPQNGLSQQEDCAEYFTIADTRVYGAVNGFELYVDGVLQTDTYVPDYVTDLPGGQYILGYDWWGNPVFTPWHSTTGRPFYFFNGEGVTDYCHEYYFQATNNCGTSTSPVYTIRDNCVFGPCDFHEIEGVKRLEELVVVYPNPSTDVFTVSIARKVDLALVRRIVVRDSNLNEVLVINAPKEHELSADASAWPVGTYFATFELVEDGSFTKNLLKI